MTNEPFDLSTNIIARLGLQNLSEEKRLELLEHMAQLVEKRVILRLMEAMSEEDAAAAEKLADQPEELLKFLASRVPDVSSVIAEETAALQNELILNAASSGAAEA
jgi:hypothetical protein